MLQTANERPPDGSARGGAHVGILGAGQLARMDLEAAIALDLDITVLASSPGDAAVRAGARARIGDHRELAVLEAFAAEVDVVTFEFEGIDPAHLAALERAGHRLVPSARAKLFAQDKLHQRRELAAAGFPVPPFAHARHMIDLMEFAAAHGWPVVMKAPRGGYDGRGVVVATTESEAAAYLAELPGGALLEPALAIECELAVQVARTSNGTMATYPVVETVQRDAMLRELVCPAEISGQRVLQACELARGIVSHIGATGLAAVELFLTPEGLLVNELALRPHNSGHHTIEATVTSQFEQHLRAALDWPLGETRMRAPAAVTVNVVGPADGSDPRDRLRDALAVGGAHIHLYGKEPRPGRKLGHVTALGRDRASARRTAWRAARILEGTS
ncbi:MAG TPA: 5-(carboxyamino)imidazole ribonucleotide synthase [Solirubrobacteraceae bacterium]|nr:5-(carboxyamino)imidazole ribonucleotide synthase [Solirubrobacteraceae bacterium]